MKRRLMEILIIGLMIMIGTTLAGCWNDTPQKRIKTICNIEIPDDATILYNYYYPAPQGDFIEYTVFGFTEEPSEFLLSLGYSECICELNHQYQGYRWPWQAEEFLPNFKDRHMFAKIKPTKKFSEVIAITLYFPDAHQLVILMSN